MPRERKRLIPTDDLRHRYNHALLTAAEYPTDYIPEHAEQVRFILAESAGEIECCLCDMEKYQNVEQCPRCQATSHVNCLDLLRNHERRHGRPLAYGCPECGVLWRAPEERAAIAAECNDRRRRTTIGPRTTYRYQHDEISGRLICAFVRPSTGRICGESYYIHQQVRRHHERDHEERTVSCDCGLGSAAPGDGQPDPSSCFCPVCGGEFLCRHAAAAHCWDQHRDQHWPPTCQLCRTKFDKYLDLVVHLSNHHQNLEPA
ncbi:hypothetical protein BO82DRAFT_199152 [Aspergillus uvarum CBS 121591]|uniref:C2H2-type domain-containing protein n=1 Tax=Aspergillus uvarum CBS 121591 TaxID=1448315 RepID=A0A319CM51_9EURO|nr:hypothetical protein BO82DRAFT_199152 [Aspergillus uvarum CBS 121591]PYH85091.1 hypothetical protein BO82DRAFT_199152 [Aspergillus uvarum CBS 121591]